MVPAPGDERQVEGRDPPGRELVDGRHGIEGPQPVARHPAAAASRPLPSEKRNAVSWVIEGVPSMTTR